MKRLLGSVAVVMLLGVVSVGPVLAQYPPSPAPGPVSPTPSQRPTARPTPSERPTPTERPGTDPQPDPPGETPTPAVPTPDPAPGAGPGGPGTQIVGGGGGGQGGGGSDEIVPGQTLTLRGSGWLPDSSVDITINSTPRHLATVMTDATGSFETTVTIPADMEVGAHTLVLAGLDAEGNPRTDSIPVAIAAAGVVPVPAPAAGGLANTGLQLTTGLALIGGLVAAGGGMLLLARRRRHQGMSTTEA